MKTTHPAYSMGSLTDRLLITQIYMQLQNCPPCGCTTRGQKSPRMGCWLLRLHCCRPGCCRQRAVSARLPAAAA